MNHATTTTTDADAQLSEVGAQLAALNRLDELLSDEQRQEFTSLWRAGESPAAPETLRDARSLLECRG